jgi:PST family polysaccharide transporter
MSRVLVSIGAIQLLAMLVALVRAKVLALLLGPSGYGIVSTVDQTVLSLVQLGALSLPFTAMKFMSREQGDPVAFSREFATFFAAICICGLLTVLAAAAVLRWLPAAFGGELPILRPYLVIALVGVPSAMVHILFVHTLAAAQRGETSAWLNMLIQLVLAAAAILGVVLGGIRGAYLVTVGAGIAGAAITLRYLIRRLGLALELSPSTVVAAIRGNPEVVSYSLLFYAAVAATSLTMLATRYFVFGGLGATQAGLLQALLGISLTVGAVLNSMIAFHFAPLMNSRLPVADKGAAANAFARRILLILIVGGMAVSLFPQTLLTILFSRAFVPGASVLFMFVLWQLVAQIANVYLQLLIGVDEVAAYAVATCVGYGIAMLFFSPFISTFGLAGAALTLSLALVISTSIAAVRLRRRFGIVIASGVVLRFALGFAIIVGARIAFRELPELTLAGVLLRAGFALGAAVLVWLLLTTAERESIVGQVGLVLSRNPVRSAGDAPET